MVTSDAHAGLKDALDARLSGVAWQRCQFHLMKNARASVPRPSMQAEVVAGIRAVFDTPDRTEAQRQLDLAVKRYRVKAPKLAEWLEQNVPESLTVFSLPARHRRRLRTSNMLERLNEEINRRTRVAGLFPNEASALRLVSAVFIGDQRGLGIRTQVLDDGTWLTCPPSGPEFTETGLHDRLPPTTEAIGTAKPPTTTDIPPPHE
jgi:transposase-like protein